MNIVEHILTIFGFVIYERGKSKLAFDTADFGRQMKLEDNFDPGMNGDIVKPNIAAIRKMQQTGQYFIPKGTEIQKVEVDWSKGTPVVTLRSKSFILTGPWTRPISVGEGKSWEELYGRDVQDEAKIEQLFQFPSDWVELLPEEKLNYSFEKDQCLDVIENKPNEIIKYLSKNPNSIVILGFGTQNDEFGVRNSICTSKTILNKLAKDKTAVYLPCVGPNGSWPVARKTRFLKLSFPQYQAYVPFKDLRKILENFEAAATGSESGSFSQLYRLKPSNLVISSTASLDSATKGTTFVSGDHCQGGTSKNISRIVPVGFKSTPISRRSSSAKRKYYTHELGLEL